HNQEWREEIANTYFHIGAIQGDLARRPESLRAYEEALRRFRALARDYPDSAKIALQTAETLFNMSSHQGALGNMEAKRKSLAESRSIVETLKKDRPNDRELEQFLSL